MLKGFRYRLEPTVEQAAVLESWAGVCRAVWNTSLEQRRAYRRRGAWMDYVQQAREPTEAKRDLPWLAEPSSDVLQQTLMDLDKACRDHGTWKVRWRSRSRWRPSMRIPQRRELLVVRRLGRKVGEIRLPKLGWVRLRWSRPVAGVVRSVTVRFEAGHWWVFVLAASPAEHIRPGTAVGIDRGVTVAVADSGGSPHNQVFVTPGEQRRMLALQRQASRQNRRRRKDRAKTSNRAKDTRAKPARVILGRGWHQFELALHHQAHADVNAASNILAWALAQATGRDGQPPPVNNGRISHDGNLPLVPRQPPDRSNTAAGIPQGRTSR